MNKEKISLKHITYEPMSKKHNGLISNFCTYESELKNFLVEDALNNQLEKISMSYLFFYKEQLAGYITLLNDSLRLEGDLKNSFFNKNVLYKTLPAVKIGRLAVDDNFLRRGLGSIMIMLAYNFANSISKNYCGCRFLILDAKKNKDPKKNVIHFYKKLNFKILKERKKGSVLMYFDIKSNNKL